MRGKRNTLHIQGICVKYKENTREIPNLKGKMIMDENQEKKEKGDLARIADALENINKQLFVIDITLLIIAALILLS